jgi:hypothetical protein
LRQTFSTVFQFGTISYDDNIKLKIVIESTVSYKDGKSVISTTEIVGSNTLFARGHIPPSAYLTDVQISSEGEISAKCHIKYGCTFPTKVYIDLIRKKESEDEDKGEEKEEIID